MSNQDRGKMFKNSEVLTGAGIPRLSSERHQRPSSLNKIRTAFFASMDSPVTRGGFLPIRININA